MTDLLSYDRHHKGSKDVMKRDRPSAQVRTSAQVDRQNVGHSPPGLVALFRGQVSSGNHLFIRTVHSTMDG